MKNIKNNAGKILVTTAAFLLMSLPALAQTPPPTACDPQYMDALEARAWSEAQREISTNKNLITKPDSVFEYSCFIDFVSDLALYFDLFSEKGCGGTCGSGLGTNSLDQALGAVVIASVENYLTTQFPASDKALGNSSTITKTSKSLGGAKQSCLDMLAVWENARCEDLDETGKSRGFYDFGWYTSNDSRKYPKACPSAGATQARFTKNIGVAFNGNQAQYVLMTENPNDTTPYNTDPVVSNFAKILPVGAMIGGSGPPVTCSAPIRTGIQVVRPNVPTYPDGICPNPGCYLDATGGSCTN